MTAIPPTSVNIEFADSPSKVTFTPSGVWGSTNYQGKLVVHLFVEYRHYPDSAKIVIDSQKNTASESFVFPPGDVKMIRETQATLVVDHVTAEVIGNWFLAQGKALGAQIEGKTPILSPTKS